MVHTRVRKRSLNIFISGVILLVFTALFFILFSSSFYGLFFGKEIHAAGISVTVKIGLCGDDFLDTGEQCDGSELGGQTCTSRGFDAGSLSCDISCEFDTSSCTITPPPSGGGGGGGGGGGIIQLVSTGAVFRGTAYPNIDVTLLKNAVVVATTKAGPDASFDIQLTNLSSGIHSFGVWAEDARGYRSITQTFTISITQDVTTSITGIFLPPTISVDKSEVRKGDVLSIIGQSVPLAIVTVFVNSQDEIVEQIDADASGTWLYQLDTLELELGDHTARSRAEKNNAITIFSNTVSFKVGTKNIAAEGPRRISKGDLNNDNKVNLIDFSIAAFWYKRSSLPANIDLNSDGIINLVDFSIMAFYWTG